MYPGTRPLPGRHKSGDGILSIPKIRLGSAKPPDGVGESLSSGPTSFPGENTRLGKVFTRLAKKFARLANSLASEEIIERVIPVRT
jgi:hypothetical protein